MNPLTYPICNDYNECSLNAHNCDIDAICVNSVPGFYCVCNPGFRDLSEERNYYSKDGSVENGRVCEQRKTSPGVSSIRDENTGEISKINDNQDDLCIDVNCPSHSSCVSTDSSFTCVCKIGYKQRNGVCENINECRLSLHSCASQAACFDTDGSFECVCIEGRVFFEKKFIFLFFSVKPQLQKKTS